MKHELWSRIADLAGIGLDASQLDRLARYRDWLVDEATVQGGIGPGEAERVDSRHIGDSLLFAKVMPQFPAEVWDLGSGVGLPGIPLSIAVPGSHFIMVERSGRRADLLERAVRVLELDNVTVARQDIGLIPGPVGAIVSRATLTPPAMAKIAGRTLQKGGHAVIGGSWRSRPVYRGWETVEIPPDPLDHAVWLLIMRRQ